MNIWDFSSGNPCSWTFVNQRLRIIVRLEHLRKLHEIGNPGTSGWCYLPTPRRCQLCWDRRRCPHCATPACTLSPLLPNAGRAGLWPLQLMRVVAHAAVGAITEVLCDPNRLMAPCFYDDVHWMFTNAWMTTTLSMSHPVKKCFAEAKSRNVAKHK